MLKKEKLRKFMPIFSGILFFSMTSYSLVGMFSGKKFQPKEPVQQVSIEQQIASQKKGYEIVLEREPNNEIALRGLVDIAIQTNDLPAAIAPLEKLAALNPQEEGYQKLLEEVKFRANQNTSEKPTNSSPEN